MAPVELKRNIAVILKPCSITEELFQFDAPQIPLETRSLDQIHERVTTLVSNIMREGLSGEPNTGSSAHTRILSGYQGWITSGEAINTSRIYLLARELSTSQYPIDSSLLLWLPILHGFIPYMDKDRHPVESMENLLQALHIKQPSEEILARTLLIAFHSKENPQIIQKAHNFPPESQFFLDALQLNAISRIETSRFEDQETYLLTPAGKRELSLFKSNSTSWI